MKKAILILTLVGILLAGCGKVKDGSSETTVAKSMTENDYNEDVEKLTDKSVYQTIVEDFDSDNNNEAFVLTRKGKDNEAVEDEFELWFSNGDKTEKIVSAIPSAAELEQLAELHKAMGDHTRMRILWHLTQKEYCVSDLAKEIGVTESALSHQLRALRIVRLVRSRKEGKKVIYSLQDEHIGWVLEETYAHISER